MPPATVTPVAKKSGKPAEPRERFDFRVDPEWLARIQAQVDRFGMALSAYIRTGATEKLERDESTDPGLGKPRKS